MRSAVLARYRSAYHSATRRERLQGRLWYPTATALAKEIGAAHNHDWRNVARSISALSPRMPWERNIALTWELASGRNPKALSRSVSKARLALTGKPALNGPKERSFAAAILGNRRAVTIDAHMLRVAGYPPKVSLSILRECQHALSILALELDEDPRDLQAIIWLVARNHGQLSFLED